MRPLRSGGDALRTVERFFSSYPALAIEPVSLDVARSAAALRARHVKLRLPDALIIATGEHLGAERILACDGSWSRVTDRAVNLAVG